MEISLGDLSCLYNTIRLSIYDLQSNCYITNTIVSRPMILTGDSRKRFEALSGLGEICGG
jgi:hypothetical protein